RSPASITALPVRVARSRSRKRTQEHWPWGVVAKDKVATHTTPPACRRRALVQRWRGDRECVTMTGARSSAATLFVGHRSVQREVLARLRCHRITATGKEGREMPTWLSMLEGNPLPWLLEDETPAVRHLALRQLLDQPEDAPAVRQARHAAMQTDPIAAILAAEQPEGYWVKPGPGYTPKYRGTVWQLTFLDQLGADGTDARVKAACAYVLSHSH